MAKETVTETVTDEDLAKAFEEYKSGEEVEETEETVSDTPVVEEEAKEEAKETVEDESVEEHKERSKMGRKLKGLKDFEEKLAKIDKIDRIEEMLSHLVEKPVKVDEVVIADDEAEIERINDLWRENPVQAKREQDAYEAKKMQKVRASYENEYVKKLNSQKSVYGDIHDEVMAELLRVDDNGKINPKYNIAHTGNPTADATINYERARADLLIARASGEEKPVYPGKGDASKSPVQPAGTTSKTASKGVTLPKLTKDEQDYVNYLRSVGTTDDEIAKSLGVK